ncbi:hypothetical protein F443_07574 [Phytophthora nicotianae P1569]|uniref:Uncharacterized protein n=1 Tax=Phytophthora nicotianae P1569 TaxID=1317065 RepID=V9FAD3_PHYNI|nr:hypothetical protein F443_07574 [Phytophthora nicotianae P1569]
MAKEKGMSIRDALLDMVKDKKCGFTRMDVDPSRFPRTEMPNGGAIEMVGSVTWAHAKFTSTTT